MNRKLARLAVLSFALIPTWNLALIAQAPPGGPASSHPPGAQHDWGPGSRAQVVSSWTLQIGGSTLQVDFAAGELDLTHAQILPWIQRSPGSHCLLRPLPRLPRPHPDCALC
jgi:hypothetical protein